MKKSVRNSLLFIFSVFILCGNSFAQTLETGILNSAPEPKFSDNSPKLKPGEKIVKGTQGNLDASLTFEGFEDPTFPPAGWTTAIVSGGATQYWLRNTVNTGYGMSNGAAYYNFFNSAAGDKQYLQTPTFPATTSGEILQFDLGWVGYAGAQNGYDTLQIQVSSDGVTFTDIALWINDSNAVSIPAANYAATGPKSTSSTAGIQDSYWTTKRLNLPVGTVAIRFLATSGFGNNAVIDNVSTFIPNFGAPMTGAYTIDPGQPASSTNYQTFTAASTDLSDRGVSGPVTLTIAAGSYNERFKILPIAGTSSTNTVTFTSGGGVTLNVTNTATPTTSSTTDFAIALIGCDWVTIQNIAIVDNGITAATRVSRGIVFGSNSGNDGARHNTIQNCAITLGGGSIVEGVSIGIIGTGYVQGMTSGTADSNTISNCTIDNADRGIGFFAVLGGNNVPYPSTYGINVINNTLGATKSLGMNVNTGGGPIGIIIQGIHNAVCTGNSLDSIKVVNATSTAGITGITAQVASGIFANNRVKYVSHTNLTSATPILIGFQAGANPGANTIVYNNTITGIQRPFTGTATATNLVFGLQVTNFITGGTPGYGVIAANNSVYLANPTTVSYSSSAFRLNVTGVPAITYNNLFINNTSSASATASHVALNDANTTRTILISNYNCLFANGTNGYLGRFGTTNTATLALWQGGVTDTNSVTGLPVFISNTLLNPDGSNSANWVLNGNGQPLSFVATDIVGTPRSTATLTGPTDIGAYEFTQAGTPPAASMSGTIGFGNTTTWTSFGRIIGSITWGPAGTLPGSMTVQYFSGATPPNPPATTLYGQGYWEFTPDVQPSGGATYDITLNFSEAQTGTIDDPSTELILAKYDGGAWTPYLSGVGAGQSNLNWTAKTVTVTGLTSFSAFALTDSDNPLPVELTSFVSATDRNKVELKWSTAMESNNSGFNIERKLTTDNQWSTVGNVAGKGNSNSLVNYSFTENNVTTGKYNYRLKQIDYNGNYKYYDLASEVIVGIPTKFELSQNYPNPFNPSTKINYDLPFDSKVGIKIFDLTGREVAVILNTVQTAGYHTVNFNASSLSSGVYFYQINAEGGNQNFVKTLKMMLIK